MREEIRRVCKQHGLTTLYVTHDQKEALAIADRIAVMRAGRLVQLGTPWQVYRRPESREVATFLGETNLLEASVTAVSGEELRVRAGELELVAEAWTGLEAGSSVLLSIRPECLRVSSERPGPHAFAAKLESTSYLGELCELRLACGTLELRAYQLNPLHPEPFTPGHELWVEVQPSDVVVLPPDRTP
jgi:iron(III) transport system ATP-binding protein